MPGDPQEIARWLSVDGTPIWLPNLFSNSETELHGG